jgi:hypothetical protein
LQIDQIQTWLFIFYKYRMIIFVAHLNLLDFNILQLIT